MFIYMPFSLYIRIIHTKCANLLYVIKTFFFSKYRNNKLRKINKCYYIIFIGTRVIKLYFFSHRIYKHFLS